MTNSPLINEHADPVADGFSGDIDDSVPAARGKTGRKTNAVVKLQITTIIIAPWAAMMVSVGYLRLSSARWMDAAFAALGTLVVAALADLGPVKYVRVRRKAKSTTQKGDLAAPRAEQLNRSPGGEARANDENDNGAASS